MRRRRYRVELGGRILEVDVARENGTYRVWLGDRELTVDLAPPGPGGVRRVQVAGRRFELLAQRGPERVALALEGVSLDLRVEDERTARLASFGGGRAQHAGRVTLAAPMPGLVVRVNASVGQVVKAGECLVVLQAMKMENELGSPRDGTVVAVNAEPGQAVEQGQLLVTLE